MPLAWAKLLLGLATIVASIVIVDDLKNTTQVYYSGIILSKSITEKNTRISFNDFSGYSPN
jgi:hypothetical protein